MLIFGSLRSRRLEVVGTRKNVRARRRHACLPRARPLSLSPTTSKRLLCRLVIGLAKTTLKLLDLPITKLKIFDRAFKQ